MNKSKDDDDDDVDNGIDAFNNIYGIPVNTEPVWSSVSSNSIEPRHEKSNNLHMRKQRRRSASR